VTSVPRGPAGGVAAGLSDYGNVSMVMSTRTVSASQFKAQCLAMLDEVAATGEEITVTKRGRAVARVLAASEPQSLRGSVSFNVSDEDLIEPLDVEWDAAGQ
jgi:prevent-host-death family protein